MKTNESEESWGSQARGRASVLLALLLLSGLPGLARQAGPSFPLGTTLTNETVHRLVEVNKYWLVGPPPEVRSFSYTLNRPGGVQDFAITEPAQTPRARLQGMTYVSVLQQLAHAPESVSVRESNEGSGRMRLTLIFATEVRGAIGNGVENSWNGYHSFAAKEGYVLIDPARGVPLEAGSGRLRETFSDYVQVDSQHYVPLSIHLQLDDTQYDWHFSLFEPGLWLLDEGLSGSRRLAWVEKVQVNSAPAQLRETTTASRDRAQAEQAGQAQVEEFLKANRHWLLPSLEARRGLVYDYRQEAPYRERVLLGSDGNLMVQLEATKETPDHVTRQRLWLADGRSCACDAGDRFVQPQPGTNSGTNPDAWLPRDRLVQHLAMGLALDCAVTRLAREPSSFWAEARLVADSPSRYLLTLRPKQDARLFTGTMLTFSSWCYMHDVRYDPSEILCDAATHRPLEEKDYSGENELVGSYQFSDWLGTGAGAAPGRLRAVLPLQKDGKDQSLGMVAQFHFIQSELWLLERVESWFRGDGGGSTGTVSVVSAEAAAFAPIQELLQKAQLTERILGTLQKSPQGRVTGEVKRGEWSALALRAAWTDKAREAVLDRKLQAQEPDVIGVQRVRVRQTPEGDCQVELDGLSTSTWKEFATEWKVGLLDSHGGVVASATTNLAVLAEGGPTPFEMRIEIPDYKGAALSEAARISIEGTVQRSTGTYHGHGRWYRLARDNGIL
jgi:hypothetical protein